MSIYNELLDEFNNKKDRANSLDENDKLQLMFIGYALDAVDMVKSQFKIELDFTEKSIENVERILDRLNRTLKIEKPSSDLILSHAKIFTGYIGQVMKIKWGGIWKNEEEYSINNGPALHVEGQDLFLLSKVYRRITVGPEDNIWHFYQFIKKDIEGSSDLVEIEIKECTIEKQKNWFQRIFKK